jgi:hypothetical protein
LSAVKNKKRKSVSANPAGVQAFAVVSVKGGYIDKVIHCTFVLYKCKVFLE